MTHLADTAGQEWKCSGHQIHLRLLSTHSSCFESVVWEMSCGMIFKQHTCWLYKCQCLPILSFCSQEILSHRSLVAGGPHYKQLGVNPPQWKSSLAEQILNPEWGWSESYYWFKASLKVKCLFALIKNKRNKKITSPGLTFHATKYHSCPCGTIKIYEVYQHKINERLH